MCACDGSWASSRSGGCNNKNGDGGEHTGSRCDAASGNDGYRTDVNDNHREGVQRGVVPVFIMYPRVGRGGQAGRPEGYPEVRTDVQSCFCDLQQKTLWYLEGRPRFVILRRGVCGGGGRTAAALSSNMGAQCDVIDGSRHSRYFSPHPSSNGAPKVGRGEPSPARRADLIDA